MPVMNGIATTKEIKKMYPSMPVITVTTMADKIDTATLTRMGFTSMLKKPLNKNIFLETLRNAIFSNLVVQN